MASWSIHQLAGVVLQLFFIIISHLSTFSKCIFFLKKSLLILRQTWQKTNQHIIESRLDRGTTKKVSFASNQNKTSSIWMCCLLETRTLMSMMCQCLYWALQDQVEIRKFFLNCQFSTRIERKWFNEFVYVYVNCEKNWSK